MYQIITVELMGVPNVRIGDRGLDRSVENLHYRRLSSLVPQANPRQPSDQAAHKRLVKAAGEYDVPDGEAADSHADAQGEDHEKGLDQE
jgi:hypothetical protein